MSNYGMFQENWRTRESHCPYKESLWKDAARRGVGWIRMDIIIRIKKRENSWLNVKKQRLCAKDRQTFNPAISLRTLMAMKVIQSVVFSVSLYGCESWPMNEQDGKRTDAYELAAVETRQ